MTAKTPTNPDDPTTRQKTLRWVLIILMLAFFLAPLTTFFINAFSFRWFYPQFIPNEFSLDAWSTIFSPGYGLLEAMGNSLFIAIIVTIVSVIIGIPAARALGLYEFRFKRLVEFLIIAPIIVPPVSVIVGITVNFIRLGLYANIVGVMLVHLIPVMPYVVLTLSGVFANYNPEFEQQAKSLGAGPIATFWYVTLPSIFPGLMVAGLFAFLVSWSQYILTFAIGTGNVLTMPTLLFTVESGGKNPNIAAVSLVFVLPAILILLITSRYLSGNNVSLGGFGRV